MNQYCILISYMGDLSHIGAPIWEKSSISEINILYGFINDRRYYVDKVGNTDGKNTINGRFKVAFSGAFYLEITYILSVPIINQSMPEDIARKRRPYSYFLP